MNTPTVKTGIWTSEFWITVISSVTGISMTLGYLDPQQADDFIKAVVAVLGGIMSIVSTVVYVVGRVRLKQTIVESGTLSSTVPVTEQIEKLEADPGFYPR